MASWDEAHSDWHTFTRALSAAQSRLHCSYRNAWFRGHEDPTYSLIPSALRQNSPPGLGTELNLRNGGKGPDSQVLRFPGLLAIDGAEWIGGRCTLLPESRQDTAESSLETDIRVALREARAELVRSVNSSNAAQQELDELQRQLTAVVVPKSEFESQYRKALVSRQREVKHRLSDLREAVSRLRHRILGLRSVFYGERDLFLTFRQRSVMITGESSWLTLAAMQHHGAPTRLLDWTTAAGVALYFALKSIRERMIHLCGSVPNWLEQNAGEPGAASFMDLPAPTIWVLNPYLLARRTTSSNRIEDPSLKASWDYLRCFHDEYSWPFNGAVPAIIPWKSERMFAQCGVYTIHGRDTRPLEQQMSPKHEVLERVSLSIPAAIYAVRHIVQFIGLDQFSVFRGEDDIGGDVRQRGRRHLKSEEGRSAKG